jgi:lysyl-tRNA synthetase class 2
MSTQDDIVKIRLEKIQKLEDSGVEAYPAKYEITHSIGTIIESFEELENKKCSVAGRIVAVREHGKVTFYRLRDHSGEMQLFVKQDVYGDENYANLDLLDIGDIVGVEGEIIKTRTGEVSILVAQIRLLSKALRALPEKWEGLIDKETRLRKRYLDLLVNADTRRIFETRHKLVREMREYFDELGYTEVETPVLQPLYGGANAKPFTTRINALDTQAYLRIASELYLKRLLVAQIGPVFDIAKDFRNEGVDQTHYPEFTMMELYIPYADYQDMMNVVESLLKRIAKNVLKTTVITIEDEEVELDQHWERIGMQDLIQRELGINTQEMSESELDEFGASRGLDLQSVKRKGEKIFLLFDKLISKSLKNPTWVIDYPQEVSPLAKRHRSKAGLSERFELYVAGREIVDGWSEKNDPVEQRQAFEAEHYRKLDESEVAQPIDEDFLEALEYGMPPAAGVGIGIDRLTMLFTNNWQIQETILFPYKKPELPH